MPKKLTQEEFIRRANEIHNGRYDYSKVQYVNGTTPVIIICPEHGEFSIKPQKHLAGQGCKPCGYIRNSHTLRKDTAWFIAKATKVYHGKYDYSRAVYNGAEEEVEIICPIHGLFKQRAVSHTSGYGCNKCAIEEVHNQQRKPREQFIAEVKAIFGDRYDFSKVDYKRNRLAVTVICPKHGAWQSRPNDLLRGHGCPKCADEENAIARMLDRTEFIERATKIHNGYYDYSKVHYLGMSRKVEIICPVHGSFWQVPNSHLQGKGCVKCKAEKQKSLVCGVGVNDVLDGQREYAYKVWSNMLRRCYDEKWRHRNLAYADCSVCDEWHTYSAFRDWFNIRFKDGYVIDKDILVHGNKVYSPQTCLLVPWEINALIISKRASRGRYPIGVHKEGKKFVAAVSKRIKSKHTAAIGRFDTPEEAFYAYKQAKEAYLKEIAEDYYKQGKITKEVYLALQRYKVEITD